MLKQRPCLVLWGVVAATLALFGLAAGGSGAGLSIGILLSLPLVAASVWLIGRLDDGGRVGAVENFFLALSLRWLAATCIQVFVYGSRPGLFAPDEIGYDEMSRYLADALVGRAPMPADVANMPGLVWVNALVYAAVGHSIMAAKLFIGIAGAWSAALAALIAREFLPSEAARRTGLLAACFPSLVLWSSVVLKDPWTLLGNELALWALLRLSRGFRLSLLFAFIVGLGVVAANRRYAILFLVAAAPWAFFGKQGKRTARNLVVLGLVVFIAVVVIRVVDPVATVLGDSEGTFEHFGNLRTAYTEEAGSAIDLGPLDTSTPLGLLLWAPLGLVYFFFAPIPFTGTSILSLATSPEMLLWYALLPSLTRGARGLLRAQRARLMPLAVYLVFSSVSWSVLITNVGSLYRYRSQVMFVLLMFIAYDQVRRRDERVKAAHARVIAPPARARLATEANARLETPS